MHLNAKLLGVNEHIHIALQTSLSQLLWYSAFFTSLGSPLGRHQISNPFNEKMATLSLVAVGSGNSEYILIICHCLYSLMFVPLLKKENYE